MLLGNCRQGEFQPNPLSTPFDGSNCDMTTAKKTRKFGAVKRIIGSRDARLKKNQEGESERKSKEARQGSQVVREIPQVSSALFFQYNTALVPPYSVLVDVSNLRPTCSDWEHFTGE